MVLDFIKNTNIEDTGSVVNSYGTVQGGPFSDDIIASILSPYGERPPLVTPNGTTQSFHTGVDLWAWPPPELYALADGIVEYSISDYPNSIAGNWIRVQIGNGYSYEYYHLAYPPLFSAGQQVRKGDIIGQVGTTGLSTGPHLHLGMKQNGISIDPIPFLKQALRIGEILSVPIISLPTKLNENEFIDMFIRLYYNIDRNQRLRFEYGNIVKDTDGTEHHDIIVRNR